MKIPLACLLLLITIFCLIGGNASAVQLNQPGQNAQVCNSICNYDRLGIKSYVESCLLGCRLYQNAYYTSGVRESSLATCKAACPSGTRNICEYGCNAAQRSFP